LSLRQLTVTENVELYSREIGSMAFPSILNLRNYTRVTNWELEKLDRTNWDKHRTV
jgi:hypothetical protein